MTDKTPGLLRQTFRAIVLPLLFVAAGTLVVAPMLTLGQTDQSTDRSYTSDMAPVSKPLLNLAVTSLFRAGYIRMVPPEMTKDKIAAATKAGEQPDPAAAEVRWTVNALPQSSCTYDPLIAALVAAEVYMRPAPRRALEESVAEAQRALFGRYPDWSYGIGQVRLSTAEAAIAQMQARLRPFVGLATDLSLAQDDVFRLLTDKCSNIGIVAMVVALIRQPDDSAGQIAARYRGGEGRPTIRGVVGYEELVRQMAEQTLPAITSGDQSLRELATDGFGDQEQTVNNSLHTGVIPLEVAPTGDVTPLVCLEFEVGFSARIYGLVPADLEEQFSDTTLSRADVQAAMGELDASSTQILVVDSVDPLMFDGATPFERFSNLSEAFSRVPGLTTQPWKEVLRLPVLPAGLTMDTLNCSGIVVLARTQQGARFFERVRAETR